MKKTWHKPLTIAIRPDGLSHGAKGREWLERFFKFLNRPAVWVDRESAFQAGTFGNFGIQNEAHSSFIPEGQDVSTSPKTVTSLLREEDLSYTLLGPQRRKDPKDPGLLASHFAEEADIVFMAGDREWREGRADALLEFETGQRGVVEKVLLTGASSQNLKKKSFEEAASLAAALESLGREKAKGRPLKGLVLTGGKSRRMGRDKSRLSYYGRPQWQVAMESLEPYCQTVFLSCRDSRSAVPEVLEEKRIYDTYLNKGPMGGILSALEQDPDASWLVLACDLPHVTGEVLDYLIQNRDPFKLATAFRSSHDGLPEPLCALYEPRSLGRLLRFLSAGISCPRKALIHSNARLLDLPDAKALDNINFPEEYEASLRAIQSRD